MPSSCCVPGCVSNYYRNARPGAGVPVFTFPADTAKREKWLKAIRRSHFVPSKRTVVCIRHFDNRFIIREDSVTRPDGTILTVKRHRLKLNPDAVPSIFFNESKNKGTKLLPVRKDPSARREKIKKREYERKQQVMLLDYYNLT